MTTRLEECALLVTLSVSEWTGRKYDRKVSNEVAFDYKADTSVGRYNKSLLPKNSYLSNVHAKTVHIRRVFAENTLPWGIEGTHLLPNKNFMTFSALMRKEKADWYTLVDDFVRAFPNLQLEAQRFLPNGLFNLADYPKANEIRSKFRMDIATFPVPTSDFRVQMAEEERTALAEEIEERVQSAARAAMNETWKRLYASVEKVATKLSDPSAIFRDSLIENAKDICALLPRLNFSGDQDLEDMRKEVLKVITSEYPDTLRNDLSARKRTYEQAQDIMRRMASYMGEGT